MNAAHLFLRSLYNNDNFKISLVSLRPKPFYQRGGQGWCSHKNISVKKFMTRLYSTNCNQDINLLTKLSATDSLNSKIFQDADKEKLEILKYGKNRSGIYL